MLAGCPGSSQAPKTQQPPASGTQPAAQPIAPPQPAKSEASAAGGAVPSIPAEAYSYKPAGRRDPFAPIVEREEKKEQKLGLAPLERYAIAEFKLTGIVWGGFGYNAMLEAPDGKGYFVRVGTVIGQHHGVVKKITKDIMIVEETYKNYMGDTERKQITVQLHKKQEGLP